MSLYSRLSGLPLEISECRLEPLELAHPSGWTRMTTIVRLRGGGLEGLGEDVNWSADDQRDFQASGAELPLAGTYALDEFSRRLEGLELFRRDLTEPSYRLYRRWAFESAALDLALQQAGSSLATILEMSTSPVGFVVSTGLGDPPSLEPIRRCQRLHAGMQFKVDLSSSWNEAFIGELAATEAINVVDLKGHYRGSYTGPPADAELYRLVTELLPDVWIEDPDLNPETEAVLADHMHRVTWDAPLHSVADIATLTVKPAMINIKPSRFGFLSELVGVYEYCNAQGIGMYSGGQFELGPGRGQIQYLASLFHPNSPNDAAPRGYNAAELPSSLPGSPLPARPSAAGFRWGEDA